MLLADLSTQERKLYSLIAAVLAFAFVVGILGGLISFGGKANERADNWQASSVAEPEDTLAQYTIVSELSRWYQDPALAQAQTKAEEQKSLEGLPASFKLLGIVARGGKKVALFMPLAGLTTPSARKLRALAEGDTLIGDWKVKELTASKVTLMAEKEGVEPQLKEFLLYTSKKP
jgi:hypothetical protein